jgi:hypothetical protein
MGSRHTKDRIIFDHIVGEPIRTDDGEPRTGGAVERTDRTKPVSR